MPVTLQTIRAARQRIGDAIYHSPLPYSLSLSRLCRCQIYCKLEHLQMTGSFKERGARNKLLSLNAEEKKRGVIAASAGNHALGLAYHGQLLGIPVTVVMPKWAPLVKLTNCRHFGAQVLLHGESYDDALQYARTLAAERSLVVVPGFDDEAIIAGQGTIGLEILEDLPDVDAVLVPVGGGGLIAGVGTAIKALRPEVRVIGVEPAHAPTLARSIGGETPLKIPTMPTLADGLAVAQAGRLCLDAARRVVDRVVLVEEDALALAVLRLMELEKMVVEGAGAAPLAALLAHALDLDGKKVALVLSGGNIDMTLISRIIERGMVTDGRLARIIVHISDRPGSLAQLLTLIAQTGASIKDVSHDRSFGPADIGRVTVACVVETRDRAHVQEIRDALTRAGHLCEPEIAR